MRFFASDDVTEARIHLRHVAAALGDARGTATTTLDKVQLGRAHRAVVDAIRTLTDVQDVLLKEGQ